MSRCATIVPPWHDHSLEPQRPSALSWFEFFFIVNTSVPTPVIARNSIWSAIYKIVTCCNQWEGCFFFVFALGNSPFGNAKPAVFLPYPPGCIPNSFSRLMFFRCMFFYSFDDSITSDSRRVCIDLHLLLFFHSFISKNKMAARSACIRTVRHQLSQHQTGRLGRSLRPLGLAFGQRRLASGQGP